MQQNVKCAPGTESAITCLFFRSLFVPSNFVVASTVDKFKATNKI